MAEPVRCRHQPEQRAIIEACIQDAMTEGDYTGHAVLLVQLAHNDALGVLDSVDMQIDIPDHLDGVDFYVAFARELDRLIPTVGSDVSPRVSMVRSVMAGIANYGDVLRAGFALESDSDRAALALAGQRLGYAHAHLMFWTGGPLFEFLDEVRADVLARRDACRRGGGQNRKWAIFARPYQERHPGLSPWQIAGLVIQDNPDADQRAVYRAILVGQMQPEKTW